MEKVSSGRYRSVPPQEALILFGRELSVFWGIHICNLVCELEIITGKR